jgi:DNA (cytosine-5)-methyltransferase 1
VREKQSQAQRAILMARTFKTRSLPPGSKCSPTSIPVVDVFAGPGGLGEGFSAIRSDAGHPRFRVCLSIEKDPRAHRTLEIRSFWRQFPPGIVPAAYYDFLRGDISQEQLFKGSPLQAKQASTQAWLAELGRVPHAEVRTRIQLALSGADKWVLIGGPPCQAYSIVARSRGLCF